MFKGIQVSKLLNNHTFIRRLDRKDLLSVKWNNYLSLIGCYIIESY